MDLPAGYTSRPLQRSDAHDVYAVMAAQEVADVGEAVIEEADILADWQRPSYDLEARGLGVVHERDGLVAWAELTREDSGEIAVHPDHRGRGLGTALVGWMRELAASRGARVVGTSVPEGSPGDRLLTGLGYHERWRSWVLALPEGAAIEPQPLADGYRIVTADTEALQRAAFEVKEDAFLEWSEREREDVEDWAATSVRRPGFEPWMLRVVVEEASGEVVGVCVLQLADGTGYVAQLAVRRDRRGLGLARTLLVDAFANAREHGATRSELATDTRTGALGLYERVGMQVTSTWVHRAVHL